MLCTENREILAGLGSPRQDSPLYLCESCPERVFYIQIAGIKQDRIRRLNKRSGGAGLIPFVALLDIGQNLRFFNGFTAFLQLQEATTGPHFAAGGDK
jgi:hypothetical protein